MLGTGSSATETNKLMLWPRDAGQARLLAVVVWVIPLLVISVMVASRPTHRTVTIDSYHYAAGQWWAGQSLYAGPSGMNYLPHFAVLFSPFHALPLWLGEVLWRWLMAGTLIGGLWWMLRALFRSDPDRPFFWATVTSMPLCLSALRNGNANALFGGVTLLAVVAIFKAGQAAALRSAEGGSRPATLRFGAAASALSGGGWWWLAAGLMALLTAIKPLGIVLIMLAPLFYAPLRGRLLVALLGLALFPFLFGRPDYVASQYRDAWTNLQACAVVTDHRFADINGIFRTFGAPLGPEVSKLVRVLAGALTAGLWWLGARRLRAQSADLPALWLYALATAYLMVFNPMNEANSFAILAPALGVWAVWFLFAPEAGAARWRGWVLFGMALSMGLLPNVVRPLFGNYFALFWHPFVTLVFVVLLARFIWGRVVPDAGKLTVLPQSGDAPPATRAG